MSTYRFSIHDYHAIKAADIDIDSITAIAGVNGTGKSTISKWLYYLVCGMTEYTSICKHNMLDAALVIAKSTSINLAEVRASQEKLNNMYSSLLAIDTEAFDFDDKLADAFELFLVDLQSDLQYLLASQKENTEKKRILKAMLNSYDKTYNISDMQQAARDVQKFTSDAFQEWLRQYKGSMSKLYSAQLRKQIISVFKEQSTFPDSLGFCEEGVQLYYKDTFKIPLMLQRAIYIDSPMVLSEQAEGARGVMWHRLSETLKSEQHKMSVAPFVEEINDMIGGKVEYSIDPISKVSNITYTLQTGKKIKIADAATGIKSFAYIIRLLECGALDDSTLLIIDEPEAHLHPQWIVDYARILVLLSKNYGVKILTASHSSMMVSAIKYISEKLELKGVRFYNAEEETDGQYTFVCKDNDIEDIFHSFNISYDKLDEYAL